MSHIFQVPGGPAHTQLEPGDVLIRVNGEVSYGFSQIVLGVLLQL